MIEKAASQTSTYSKLSNRNELGGKGDCRLDHGDYTTFDLGDQSVLIRHGVDRFFVLNETGRLIWEKMRKGKPANEICSEVATQYDIPLDVVRQDLERTIKQWLEKGLIGDIELRNSGIGQQHVAIGPDFERASLRRPEEWYSQKSYHINESCIRIFFGAGGLERDVHPLLSHFCVERDFSRQHRFELREGSRGMELTKDGYVVMRTTDPDCAVIRLIREVTSVVCRDLDPLLFLHAGGVARDGCSVLFPAASGSGKSTLIAALLQEDYVYLSDDIVPIDRTTFHAIPLPFSLNLKPQGLSVLEPLLGKLDSLRRYRSGSYSVSYLPPYRYATNTPSASYPVGGLAFPRYDENNTPRLSPLSPEIALRRLMETNSILPTTSDLARIEALVYWLNRTPCYELVYDGLGSATAIVNELFETLAKCGQIRLPNLHCEEIRTGF